MAFILPEESMAIIMSIPSLIISFVLLLSDGLARAKIRKKKGQDLTLAKQNFDSLDPQTKERIKLALPSQAQGTQRRRRRQYGGHAG